MSSATDAPDAPWQQVHFTEIGVLSARGADTVRFLQGQLSNDVERLSAARSQLTALHNPQGRAIALLRLVQLDGQPPQILALLPRELAGVAATRLSKFILRSKVSIRDESETWEVRGLIAPAGSPVPPALPQEVNGQSAFTEGGAAVRVPGERPRWLLITPAVTTGAQPLPPQLPHAAETGAALWQRLDIEAGMPQIRTATSELFVAQMLNLDLLEAVSFDKGCYTGQEVIARAHWRGRVKRRLQRFVSCDALAPLSPGDTRTLADGRSITVVDAVTREDGRCEFLGVTALAAGESEEPAKDAPQAGDAKHLELQALPLPYALPD